MDIGELTEHNLEELKGKAEVNFFPEDVDENNIILNYQECENKPSLSIVAEDKTEKLNELMHDIREEWMKKDNLDYMNISEALPEMMAAAAVVSENKSKYSGFLDVLDEILIREKTIETKIYTPLERHVDEEFEFAELKFLKIDRDFRSRIANEKHFHRESYHLAGTEEFDEEKLDLYEELGFVAINLEIKGRITEMIAELSDVVEIEEFLKMKNFEDSRSRLISSICRGLYESRSFIVSREVSKKTAYYNHIGSLTLTGFSKTFLQPRLESRAFPQIIQYKLENEELWEEKWMNENGYTDYYIPETEISQDNIQGNCLSDRAFSYLEKTIQNKNENKMADKLRRAFEIQYEFNSGQKEVEVSIIKDIVAIQTTLEVLFVNEGEGGGVIRNRVPMLVSELDEDKLKPEKIQKLVYKLFNLRNKVLHTGKNLKYDDPEKERSTIATFTTLNRYCIFLILEYFSKNDESYNEFIDKLDQKNSEIRDSDHDIEKPYLFDESIKFDELSRLNHDLK